MKKNNDKKFFIAGLIMMAFSSIVTVYAASYLFESEQVSYDNTSSGLTSTNVQDSLDELYNHATDYTEIKSYFQNNPTSYFDGGDLYVNGNAETSNATALVLYKNKNQRGSRLLYNLSSDTTALQAYDSSGNPGKGTLNLEGSTINLSNGSNTATVKINGTDITQLYSIGGMSVINQNNISLYGSTGSVRNNALSYKIIGNSLMISGRLELNITTRTAANPGASITIPNSRKMASTLNVHSGGMATYSDGTRHGESTIINGTAGSSTFYIMTSETHSNVASNKVLILFVPPIIIPLQ